jgi:hypothetical protein
MQPLKQVGKPKLISPVILETHFSVRGNFALAWRVEDFMKQALLFLSAAAGLLSMAEAEARHDPKVDQCKTQCHHERVGSTGQQFQTCLCQCLGADHADHRNGHWRCVWM